MVTSPDHSPHHLQVEDIHVHYGEVCALHNISFTASCGDMLALVGPNGAGKSTLIKSIAQLIPLHQGQILWRGETLHRQQQEISYLPQRSQMDWSFPMTVRALVETGRLSSVGWFRSFKPTDHQEVDLAMERMDITSLAHRQISALSGGQQQRVFIARALAQDPHVLLLDEPYAGLDQRSQEELSALLKKLRDEGRLIIAAHHDLNSVTAHFDKVLVLRRELIAQGTPQTVLTPDLLQEVFAS